VVVTDKRGDHVSALTAADFEVREDGQVQKIAGFEEVIAEASPIQRTAVAPNTFTNQFTAKNPKKLEIILLDLLNTPLSGRAEARRGLIEFLSKSADADTLIALLVLRSDGVRMIHNFTGDPQVLVEAIRKVQAPVASRDTPVLKTNGGDVDAEERQLRAIFAGQAATGNGINTVGGAIAQLREMEAWSDASKQSQEGLLTLECMQQLAQYFAAVPGRKSLFWASTGFRFNIGSMSGESTRGTTPDDWQRAMRMLQNANIAVYPVDLAGVGLMGQGDISAHGLQQGQLPRVNERGSAVFDALSTGRLVDPTYGKHEAMETVAAMTGGRAYYNLNDSGEFFRRARQDSAQYYMLAYYAKDTGKSGWRKLSVRVHREGVELRARTGFFFNNAVQDPESVRQSDEIMALASALESTSLPVSGEWQQVESAGDQRKVHFALSVPPGVALVDTEHENHINLDFLVFAWNAEGKAVAKIGQRRDSKLSAAELGQVQSQGVSYKNVLTLPPGQYEVHIVVRDNLKGSLGSVATSLKVD
jgi:VWFA-related protein